jgi:hypothetical protein
MGCACWLLSDHIQLVISAVLKRKFSCIARLFFAFCGGSGRIMDNPESAGTNLHVVEIQEPYGKRRA